MANFAKLDTNNYVEKVLVVPDDHAKRGSAYLSKDLGLSGKWVKCDNGAVGHFYNEAENRFEPNKPFESWSWSDKLNNWDAPTPRPGAMFYWDEQSLSWLPVEIPASNA